MTRFAIPEGVLRFVVPEGVKRRAFSVLAGGALCITWACSRSDSSPRVLDVAGATLPYPLYAKWSSEYLRVDPNVRINYQSVGSGAGIRQVTDGVVDFGATDEPLNDEQMKRAPAAFVHVPMTIGAVVLAFHLPGVTELRLTAEAIAAIFLGTIARWDDPTLRETNPGVPLPSGPITVSHRADGSGSSATFSSLLSRRSDAWRTTVGAGTAPRFPVGVGAKGNDGVTAFVKATPLSIGYVELAYAKQAKLTIALVRNRAGKYVPPTLEALDRAARSSLSRLPEDNRLSIVDSDDEGAYPISALSFVIVRRDARDPAKGKALAKFLWWAIHDGQKLAAPLDYAPLPAELVTRAERSLQELKAEGQPLLARGP